jgi:hypothetical protein
MRVAAIAKIVNGWSHWDDDVHAWLGQEPQMHIFPEALEWIGPMLMVGCQAHVEPIAPDLEARRDCSITLTFDGTTGELIRLIEGYLSYMRFAEDIIRHRAGKGAR